MAIPERLDRSYRQLADDRGVRRRSCRRLHQALGFAPPEPGAGAGEDDVTVLDIAELFRGAGVGDDATLRLLAVYADSLRRIAKAEAEFYEANIERRLHQRRRTLTPEEVGHLLAACRPFYRDHFLIQVGTGLRSGELLGLRRRRVFPELGRIEVRYEAGRFGRGFKAEPKSLASVRVVPMCDQVRQAIARRVANVTRPEDLVLPGPGGSNGIPRGARAPLSTTNLRRSRRPGPT